MKTLLMAVILLPALVAQAPVKQGTYISSDEVQAFLKRVEGTQVSDQQVRAVNVGKTNVAIGVVYRGKLAAPAKQSVAEHDQVSEVYHIIDGSATLVTSPDIVGPKRRPATLEVSMLWSQLDPSLVRKMGSRPCVRLKRRFISSAEMPQPSAGRWQEKQLRRWCRATGRMGR